MFSEDIARDQGMEWVNMIEKLPDFSGFIQIYLRIEIKFKNIWGGLVVVPDLCPKLIRKDEHIFKHMALASNNSPNI